MHVTFNNGFFNSGFIRNYSSLESLLSWSLYERDQSFTESAEPEAKSLYLSIKLKQQMIFVWSTVNL